MSKIVIIDYGMGNLRSAQKAFEKLGFAAKLTSDPADIASADKLVLPGVGAFRDCIGNLREAALSSRFWPTSRRQAAARHLRRAAAAVHRERGVRSYAGLGIIPGQVVRFPADMQQDGEELKVPHMGWNDLTIRRPSPILTGIRRQLRLFRPFLLCGAGGPGGGRRRGDLRRRHFCAALGRTMSWRPSSTRKRASR